MSRQQQIQDIICDAIDTTHIDVINESHMHSVPPNSETHFKLVLVSNDFDGKRKVARHQVIYGLLGGMMNEGLHALAIHAYTPEEWQDAQAQFPASPNCMGGSKGDA